MQAESRQLALEPERPVDVRVLEALVVLDVLFAKVFEYILVSAPEIDLFFVCILLHVRKCILKLRTVHVIDQIFVHFILHFASVQQES